MTVCDILATTPTSHPQKDRVHKQIQPKGVSSLPLSLTMVENTKKHVPYTSTKFLLQA